MLLLFVYAMCNVSWCLGYFQVVDGQYGWLEVEARQDMLMCVLINQRVESCVFICYFR